MKSYFVANLVVDSDESSVGVDVGVSADGVDAVARLLFVDVSLVLVLGNLETVGERETCSSFQVVKHVFSTFTHVGARRKTTWFCSHLYVYWGLVSKGSPFSKSTVVPSASGRNSASGAWDETPRVRARTERREAI